MVLAIVLAVFVASGLPEATGKQAAGNEAELNHLVAEGMRRSDLNRDGIVTFNEFLPGFLADNQKKLEQKGLESSATAYARMLFEQIDRNKDGHFDSFELKLWMAGQRR